jgi:aminoglycoside 3-N-acetyltransferase
MASIFQRIWLITFVFNKQSIKKSLISLGIREGDNLLIKTDFRYLGFYDGDLNQDFFDCLSEIINLEKGTIFVSTASDSLCNTNKVFDIEKTKSERGVFTNFVMKKEKSIRSLHPFLSYTGIGKHARYVCTNNSKHGYGPNSPKDRMLKINTKYLSVGLEPRWTCSYIHHVEMLIGVPYRYTKEFNVKIKIDKKTYEDYFYMFLCYLECEIERDRNLKLFEYLRKKNMKIQVSKIGQGQIHFYDCNSFVDNAINYLSNDIYGWLKKPPVNRPYQK